jgi:hypothetical protein
MALFNLPKKEYAIKFLDKSTVKPDGESVLVMDEGKEDADGKYGWTLKLQVKRLDETIVLLTITAAAFRRISSKYGNDTKNWLGKSLRMQNALMGSGKIGLIVGTP